MDNYLLSIKDRAGNQSSTITITIHTHNFVDGICTICGEGLAPANEYEKWDYTLDDAAKKITLNKYTGMDEDVTVYSNYDVDGECYKTKLRDTVDNSNLFTGNKTVKNIVFQKRIDTSNVTNMMNLFFNCSSLLSVDLSNLNTSNVTNMRWMFALCSSLTFLDVSHFDTSNVTTMSGMLEGCSSLISLNISNLNTSNATDMSNMFKNCSSLTSLDLSSFDTSNITSMISMFEGCSSLTSLDLSNFDTSNVARMSRMFKSCTELILISVTNGKWIIKNGCDTNDMFASSGVSEVTNKDAA